MSESAYALISDMIGSEYETELIDLRNRGDSFDYLLELSINLIRTPSSLMEFFSIPK
jgi:hypothetical protein